MAAGGVDVPQPTFQIAQTLQRVGLPQAVLPGPLHRQGGVVVAAVCVDDPQPTFQTVQHLNHDHLHDTGSIGIS